MLLVHGSEEDGFYDCDECCHLSVRHISFDGKLICESCIRDAMSLIDVFVGKYEKGAQVV